MISRHYHKITIELLAFRRFLLISGHLNKSIRNFKGVLCFSGIYQLVTDNFINLVQADMCKSIIKIFIEEDVILAKLEIGEPDFKCFSYAIPQNYFYADYTKNAQPKR